MDDRKDATGDALLEQLILQGPNDIVGVVARAFELAMELEPTNPREKAGNEATA